VVVYEQPDYLQPALYLRSHRYLRMAQPSYSIHIPDPQLFCVSVLPAHERVLHYWLSCCFMSKITSEFWNLLCSELKPSIMLNDAIRDD